MLGTFHTSPLTIQVKPVAAFLALALIVARVAIFPAAFALLLVYGHVMACGALAVVCLAGEEAAFEAAGAGGAIGALVAVPGASYAGFGGGKI